MPVYTKISQSSDQMTMMLVPADGGEPRLVSAQSTKLSVDKYMVACRRAFPTGLPRPWLQRQAKNARPADPQNSLERWDLSILVGCANTPNTRRRRSLTPPGPPRPIDPALPEHSRFPGIRGDVVVSCCADNRDTGDIVSMSILPKDVPRMMYELQVGWLEHYAPFVDEFRADLEEMAAEFGAVVDAADIRNQRMKMADEGKLTRIQSDWRSLEHAVPESPEHAWAAVLEIRAWCAERLRSASEASERAARQLMAEIESTERAPPRPTRSARRRLQKKRAVALATRSTVGPDATIGLGRIQDVRIEDGRVEDERIENVSSGYLQDDEDVPEDQACVVCLWRPKNTALLPCGHVCACPACAAALAECPVCRAAVVTAARIYFC